MKNAKKIIKSIWTILLAVLLLVTAFAPFASHAEEELELEGYTITTSHTMLPSTEVIEWVTEIFDESFLGDPKVFDVSLARMSLGMALSSYRDITRPHAQDDWIIQFLTGAGFKDIRTEWYDQETGEHTVSSAIAKKQVGDITVLAAVPCGGNYQNEWLSNFNIGTGERHEGFNEAAITVEQRIRQYMEDYALSGDTVLWMAGYSRGAAIANLVESDMIEAHLFTKVFAYNFAVPHNTRKKIAYPNIFNVVGKYDFIPQIPFSEWGYTRNGIDLYTPAQEMDSDFGELKELASRANRTLTGRDFVYNPGLNSQIHMVMEYLLQLVPSAEEFDRVLEKSLKNLWVNHDVSDALPLLLTALEQDEETDSQELMMIKSLRSYLETTGSLYLQGNISDIEKGYWDTSGTVLDNFLHEHNPETYLSWMYATDDLDRIFTENVYTLKVIFFGKFYLDIYRDGWYEESVDSRGYIYVNKDLYSKINYQPEIYAIRKGTQTILMLPRDSAYSIDLHPLESNTAGFTAIDYQADKIAGNMWPLEGFDMQMGETYQIYSDEDGQGIQIFNQAGEVVPTQKIQTTYSPELIHRIENLNVEHLTVTEIISIVVIVLLFILLLFIVNLVIAIVHAINCRKRGKPYSKYFVIVPHLLLATLFFLLAEFGCFYFPVLALVPAILATCGVLILTLLALRGTLRRTCKRNTAILIGAIVLTILIFFGFRFTLLGAFSTGQFFIVLAVYVLLAVLGVYSFPHDGRVRWKPKQK